MQPDLTGRERMARNVMTSWGGHFVFLVAGFVLPRLIDRKLGQEMLGVWDLSWSLVHYFGLLQAGIYASISPHVAKHRAKSDLDGVNGAVSTGLAIYLCTGTMVVILSVLGALLVPAVFGTRLGSYVREAQWTVFLLGCSLAVEFVFAVFIGVITGCHRWDIHNYIGGGCRILSTAGLIVVVFAGWGLSAMAAVTLLGELLAGVLRRWSAYYVCPGLHVARRWVTWSWVGRLLRFGGKSMLGSVSRVALYQSNALLIAYFLGPAALALFSRPLSLIRHTVSLVDKFACVFTPSASSLHAQNNKAGLARLLIQATRYGLFISLPLTVLFCIFGGQLLVAWMGPRYSAGLLLGILALGHLALFSQRGANHVLIGLNRHGLPGLANLVAAVCSVVLSVVALHLLGWGLIGTAVAIVAPLTTVSIIGVHLYACHVLALPIRSYLRHAVIGPVVSVVPFTVVLLAARVIHTRSPVLGLVTGLGLGCLALACTYYRYALPRSVRAQIAQRLLPWTTSARRIPGGLLRPGSSQEFHE